MTGFEQIEQPVSPLGGVESLPEARPAPQERLDDRALKAWRISGLLSWLVTMCFAVAFYLLLTLFDLAWWIELLPILLGLLIGVITVFVLPPIQWRRWRYAVTEHDIELQRGIIIVTRTLIPITRVQHVDTRQGPILRHYGLAGIAIATAAGTEEIPALAMHVADRLRNRISDLAGLADDV